MKKDEPEKNAEDTDAEDEATPLAIGIDEAIKN